jgi:FkbM family methyltransferase
LIKSGTYIFIMIEEILKKILRRVGLQVKRFPDRDQKCRVMALDHFRINKILDVGANTGQFASEIRTLGFYGEIVSFEPLSDAYSLLRKQAANDSKWQAVNMALGDSSGEITINISKNSQSSSILQMLPAHIQSAPQSIYINKEKVKIEKLDTIFHHYCNLQDNVLLKIDTQGYEKNVIDGAQKSLSYIKGVKLEMSLEPLYKDEMLFWDMVKFIESKGYRLYSLENTYSDPHTGKLLQVDGIFYK